MDEQTRTRPLELEPGFFLRADGERVDSIEGADSYQFRAAIFTGGEASDGDIIDMRSLRIDTEMPFFAQHMADATMQLGSLTEGAVRKGKRSLEAVWDGAIDLRGAGALQEVRQDVAHRMSTGELRRMSGRWARAIDGSTVVTRRTKLDRGHSAFVDAAKLEPEDPRGFGNHWQGAQAKEGSLVGLGADDDATGRSEAVRDFYQQCRAAVSEHEGLVPISDPEAEATPLDLLQGAMQKARSAGVPESDLVALMTAGEGSDPALARPQCSTSPAEIPTVDCTVRRGIRLCNMHKGGA